jgi:TolB protein
MGDGGAIRRRAARRLRLGAVAVCLAALPVGARQADAAGPTTVIVTPHSGLSGTATYLGPPTVSANGRFVAFDSFRSDIVAGDTNHDWDVFVRDVTAGTTQLVSVSSQGAQGNRSSNGPVDISADGRFVLFRSDATNLVAGDTNDFTDVFLRDRLRGTTSIVPHVTVDVGGSWLMSGNARYFAFGPPGHSNEVGWYNRATGRTIATTVGEDESGVSGISDDGRTVLVSGSAGPRIWKPFHGRLLRFDQASDGTFAREPVFAVALSADGRWVMFDTDAGNLVSGDTNGVKDVFVRNLVTGRTRRISVGSAGRQANRPSWGLGLSEHGRYRLFGSAASNLVRADTNRVADVFVRTRRLGITIRCSVSATGVQGRRGTRQGALSRNGRFVAFLSASANLVPGDANGRADIFERGPGC